MINNEILKYKLHGSGETKIIALHSWMDDAESWNTIIPFLNPERYTYAFVDIRGYGASKDIKGQYSLEEIKNDLFQVADDIGFDIFHLLGHSMCGMVAQYAALKDVGNRIRKIALVTPVASSGFPADDETKVFLQSIIQNVEVAKMGYGAFTSNRYSDYWYQLRATRHVTITDRDAQLSYMHMWLEEDFSDQMSTLNKPFLVFAGSHDHPMFRIEIQKKNFNSFKNVVFAEVQNSGHFPMQETPVLLASHIESFFN